MSDIFIGEPSSDVVTCPLCTYSYNHSDPVERFHNVGNSPYLFCPLTRNHNPSYHLIYYHNNLLTTDMQDGIYEITSFSTRDDIIEGFYAVTKYCDGQEPEELKYHFLPLRPHTYKRKIDEGNDDKILVLVRDHLCVGYLYYNKYMTDLFDEYVFFQKADILNADNYRFRNICLRQIFILPEYHRQGFGRMLISEMLDIENIQESDVYFGESVNSTSRLLYKSMQLLNDPPIDFDDVSIFCKSNFELK